ncbi:hypothetical protein EC957_006937 [Mortierella hygrophila]|uniref:Uncharacterized protein n=1 Tax=Mortierella hygrophila TaxID=979708 RepID=A0A9P6JYB6_9FUNG|nr:hypothetical protein EC957_006937 [Mortierella hygrophila]
MTVRCRYCGRLCPDSGYETTLPVRVHGQGERRYCLQCRQRMFREGVVVEPIPARLEGYQNGYCGIHVIPMLTRSEARTLYSLTNLHLEGIPTEIGYAVWTDGTYNRAFLVNERDVLRVARGVHGLQVGVENVRLITQAATPLPEEDILNRRDAIRTLFLQRRYFARPDLPAIQAFVQGRQGGAEELLAIVNEVAI